MQPRLGRSKSRQEKRRVPETPPIASSARSSAARSRRPGVLETDDAIAFLDINPVNHGHTLLVPRGHHAQLSDLPDALAARDRLALARGSAGPSPPPRAADGLNVIVNNGRAAGQTIDHCHWHITASMTIRSTGPGPSAIPATSSTR